MTVATLTGTEERAARATVVASGGARPELVRTLSRAGLELSVLDGLDTLGEAGWDPAEWLIVLVDESGATSFSGVLAAVRPYTAEAPVVLVCDSVGGRDLRAALAAGVVGIVLADEAPAALTACLDAVTAGLTCVPRRNRHQIACPVLSMREKQILGLVVMGYMNSQIAERLFLAESTVKSHLSSAFAKLEVHSRHEAADLILDPDGGLTLGILGLDAERLAPGAVAAP